MSEERRLGKGDMEDIMAEIKGNKVECMKRKARAKTAANGL